MIQQLQLTDIEKLHYNRLENLLLNSAIFTIETQHALVWALECIEDLHSKKINMHQQNKINDDEINAKKQNGQLE